MGEPAAWRGRAYQHANRLAHTLWLRDNGVDAWLVHVLVADDDGHKSVGREVLIKAFADEIHAVGLAEREPDWSTAVVVEAV